MTNDELLARYDRTRAGFMRVACAPNAVPGWGHAQETIEWLETLQMIRERFPGCTHPSSQGEYHLGRAVNAPRP
jgi:hypothetical protein